MKNPRPLPEDTLKAITELLKQHKPETQICILRAVADLLALWGARP